MGRSPLTADLSMVVRDVADIAGVAGWDLSALCSGAVVAPEYGVVMRTDLARSTPVPGSPSTGATVAIFALVGPLVGSVALIVFWATATGGRGVFDLGLCVSILAAGYFFGLVPAFLTGVAVVMSWRRDSPPHYSACYSVGSLRCCSPLDCSRATLKA
jgi:hypothetical protein